MNNLVGPGAPTISDEAEEPRYNVPALERGLLLLESFGRGGDSLTLAELGRRLQLPRASTFRIAQTLERMGYIVRVPGGRGYRLGPRILSLGFDYLSSLDLVQIALPHLQALRDATGAAAHLAIRDGAEIVYVARVASPAQLAGNVTVGTRFPAHATTMGRNLLSELSRAELEVLYGGKPLPAYSDKTATTLDQLEALLAEDRSRGYVVSMSTFERGIASVGAPVRDAAGKVVAAINVIVPEALTTEAALSGPITRQVLATAATISSWLGYRPARVKAKAPPRGQRPKNEETVP